MQKFAVSIDTGHNTGALSSPRGVSKSLSPRGKRQPEQFKRDNSSLEEQEAMEREAMRRLRQRKRFPSSKGHDTFEDQVVSGTRHKVLARQTSPLNDSDRLATINDGKRLSDARLAKGSLRRRSVSRTPSPRASKNSDIVLPIPQEVPEEDMISLKSPPVTNTMKKRVSLPALSEDSPLSNNTLSAEPKFRNPAGAASKYSYAKNFLLGKRAPDRERREKTAGEGGRRKRHPKTSISDDLQTEIQTILDDAHVPKGMRRTILPRICKFISDREAKLKSKLADARMKLKELERERKDIEENPQRDD